MTTVDLAPFRLKISVVSVEVRAPVLGLTS